jgi:hypothetical protein
MKVKYIKEHTDGKYVFPAGCVAEHAEGDGLRVIELGVAVQVDNEARSRRQAPETPASIECVPEVEKPKPIFGLKSK